MKMAIYHFCSRHFPQWFKLQICPSMLVLGITGPNPFYTPQLSANSVDNGFILIFGALYIELIHLWHKVHIATLIKLAFSNFANLEPWT